MNGALTLIARDVRRGYAGGGAALVCGFFLLAVVLFPFAIGPDRAILARIGPGAIWVAALLAALLPVERLVAPDAESGWFDQIRVHGLSLALVMALRIVAHWLAFAPPLMVAALVAGGLFGLDARVLALVELALLLGTPGLAALAVATGALTAGLRGAGGIAGLVLLPLALPLLIFGAGGGDFGGLKLLASVSLLLVAGAPWIAAAAIRSVRD
ncbi:heme exporter protein CcmB [Sphingomonas sp. SORGH_AS_0879]|uniref:heme exporter protein CcmB n=1 Tax=Sphingomonas sp. SORGH_AS_0879 TaxID=3041790 RepID=UPI002786FAAB|nr:heme exporter protein CcmB [Sphingomonas sp. SORGH_AS_0879]MDQ1228745.1 heme exporter protein B [Sphingomonas sp. SORGH_AS_0879]